MCQTEGLYTISVIRETPYEELSFMLANIGIPGLIIILIIILIIFGPKKLPQIGRAVGETFKEFKTSTKGMMDEENDEKEKKEVAQDDVKKA